MPMSPQQFRRALRQLRLSQVQAARRLGISREAAVKRWQRLRAAIATCDVPRDLLTEEATG